MNLISQINGFLSSQKGMPKTQLWKALTSDTGSGGALIREKLEQIITNAVPRLSVIMGLISPQFDSQKIHSFNRLTALPAVGGAMGEMSIAPTTQPTFARATTALKVMRKKGATSKFLADASKNYIDAIAQNVEASVLAFMYELETHLFYGNADASAYSFSGYDHFISTNRTNLATGSAVPTSLSFMDSLIDSNLDYNGGPDEKMIVCSPQMLSKISQLLTNVRLNQGLNGSLTQIEVNGGWRLNAYRDIPIVPSALCRPRTTGGTVTPTVQDDTATGHIVDSQTRYYQVAAVTPYGGEQMASAEVNIGSGTGGSADVHTVTLSWAANTNALYYKIYVGTVTGTVYLRHIISGFAYNSVGSISASTAETVHTKIVNSDTNGNVTSVVFNYDPNVAGVEVPTAMQLDKPLVAVGGVPMESMFFIDRDVYQGLGKFAYTNDDGARFNGLLTIEDLAQTEDFQPFHVKTYGALIDSFEATSSVVRGLRIA